MSEVLEPFTKQFLDIVEQCSSTESRRTTRDRENCDMVRQFRSIRIKITSRSRCRNCVFEWMYFKLCPKLRSGDTVSSLEQASSDVDIEGRSEPNQLNTQNSTTSQLSPSSTARCSETTRKCLQGIVLMILIAISWVASLHLLKASFDWQIVDIVHGDQFDDHHTTEESATNEDLDADDFLSSTIETNGPSSRLVRTGFRQQFRTF